MKTSQNTLHMIFLLVISFAVRMALISKGPYSVDCLQLAMAAQKTLETAQLQYHFGSGYPLTILLGALFLGAGDLLSNSDPVFCLNLMSVLFSSLCVPMLYAVSRQFTGRAASFLASLMFSFSPIFLGVSVYGTSHTPSLFFQLLGFFLLLRSRQSEKEIILFLSAVCFGLVAASRLQEFVLVSLPLIFYFFYILNRDPTASYKTIKTERRSFYFIFIAISVGSLFYMPYLLGDMRQAYIAQFLHYKSDSMAEKFYPEAAIAGVQFLSYTLTPLGLLIAFFGLIFLFKENRKLFWLCLIWAGVPLVFYSRLYSFIPRFLTIMLPPLLIAQGYCFSRYMNKDPFSRLAAIGVYILILAISMQLILPLIGFRHRRAVLPEYVRWVDDMTEDNARIIVMDDGPFFEYYGNRQIRGRPHGYFDIDDDDLFEFKGQIDILLKNETPVYITYVGLYDYDPGKEFSSFLEKHYRLEIVGEHLYEDWHRGAIFRRVFKNPLVRILKF